MSDVNPVVKLRDEVSIIRRWNYQINNGIVKLWYDYIVLQRTSRNDVVTEEKVLKGPKAVFYGDKIRKRLKQEMGFSKGAWIIFLWFALPVLSLILTLITFPLWLVFYLVVSIIMRAFGLWMLIMFRLGIKRAGATEELK